MIAIMSILVVTTIYSIALPDSNGAVGERIKRNLAASVPTIVSGNPLASPLCNIFLQVSEPVVLAEEKESEVAGKAPRSKTSAGGID